MTKTEGCQQFKSEVLNAEYEEIKIRRKNVADHEGRSTAASEHSVENDLVGLSCSGGGIRSASFSLGVIQHLIQNNLFSKVDYISTVSGGGYIGSCLTSLTKDTPGRERLLTDRLDGKEPDALNYIRNYSRYLISDGPINSLRIPVLIVEGAIRSFFTFLPIIILAVFATEIFFELTGRFSKVIQWVVPIVGIVPLLILLVVRPIFFNNSDLKGRDRSDRRLTNYAILALVSLTLIPLLALLRSAVELDSASFAMATMAFLVQHLVYIIGIAVVVLPLLALGVIKRKIRLVVLIVSILAPASIFSIYIYLCIAAINSPFVDQIFIDRDNRHIEDKPVQVKTLVDEIYDLTASLHPATEAAKQKRLANKCNCSSEQASLPSYLALEDELHGAFLQKQLHFNNYCLEGIAEKSLAYCRITNNALEGSLSDLFTRYLTTSNPPRVTLAITQEYLTNKRLLVFEELKALSGYAEWWLYLAGFLLQCYNWIFININRFSLHSFYRDKLSRTFLISKEDGKLVSTDNLKISETKGPSSTAPYHLINTALNLQGSKNPQLRSRKTVPFVLAKRYCGSDFTGYSETTELEKEDSHFDLGTAMAISAAAASPNMGTVGNNSLSFILTLLNIRLNYWLPNPAHLNKKEKKRCGVNNPLGLPYLMSEAFASVNENKPYINCSDGGHIENLGVYELLRRQCKTIVCIDAEADPYFIFEGLTTLQRYAEIDLGVVLSIDVTSIKPSEGLSSVNHAVGNIYYPNGMVGNFLYLKLSFTGAEAEYLKRYRQMNIDFPHESTNDQSFDETQFEVYRALGNFVAQDAGKEIQRVICEDKVGSV